LVHGRHIDHAFGPLVQMARTFGVSGIFAALVHFEPNGRLCFDPPSRFGLRPEIVNLRLPPVGERKTHKPLAVFRFDGVESNF
jgi:hypothetical protein